MIIVQTPLRISFFGGGTDFKDFYESEGGCVLSTAIDKYIYVVIKSRFDEKIRVGYTLTEMVDYPDELKHDLAREAMYLTGIQSGVEIGTLGDIPSELGGSGLGSSSTVTVGLLHAMYTYLGRLVGADQLAKEACKIEIERLGSPIGVQDQYIAAYGGLRFIEFGPGDTIQPHPRQIDKRVKRLLNQNLMSFFTGVHRQANSVLKEQKANIQSRLEILRRMKTQAREAYAGLQAGDVNIIGELLDEAWHLKKQLASRISNPAIDELYQTAKDAGAIGGKISGAGGGGFLLLYCCPEHQEKVRQALSKLQELPFNIHDDGSRVIFNN